MAYYYRKIKNDVEQESLKRINSGR